MKKVNVCMIGGRLSRDAEFTPEIDMDTPGTKDRAWFSLANEEIYAPAGGKPHTSFFSCVAWGKNARIVRDFTMKGKEVLLEGRFRQNRYGEEGNRKEKVEFVVERIHLGRNPKDKPATDGVVNQVLAELAAKGIIKPGDGAESPVADTTEQTASAGAEDSNSPF